MLHILLLILKIIGIIIAIVLGIVLFLLLIILFVPVRYEIKASYYEKLKVRVKITWLLHLLNGCFIYDENGISYRFRIFLYNLINSEKAVKEVKEKLKEEAKEQTEDIKSEVKEDLKEEFEDVFKDEPFDYKSKLDKPQIDEIKTDEFKTAEPKIDLPVTEDKTDEISTEEPTSKKFGFIEFLKSIYYKIKKIFTSICDTIRNVRNKTISAKDAISEKINAVKEFVNDEANQELFHLLVAQVKKLFRKLKPKKYRIYVKYGSDDPATVGEITGKVAMLNGFTGLRFEFVPVFDEKIFEAEVYLKGSITVFTLLSIAIKVYTNKQFRKFLNK